MGGLRRQLNRLSPRRFLVLALASAAPAAFPAEGRFDVTAGLRKGTGLLEVEARLQNRAAPVRALFVESELAGQRSEAELGALATGEARVFTLRFPGYLPRPGRYALTFRIEYVPDQPAQALARDEWAFVLLELGAQPQPALAVRIEPLTLDVAGTASVVLASADGAAHRAGVRILLPSGVQLLEPPLPADVPAAGEVRVPVRLLRGDAARGHPHAMIVVAGPVDGPLERASVAKGEIQIATDRAWLPRLRPGLVVLGALLLLAAVVLELRARRSLPP